MQVQRSHCSRLEKTLKLPGLSKRKDNRDPKSEEPLVNSETDCVRCAKKTAKLLIVTGQWDFYYCYRCRRWSQAHYTARHVLLPMEDARMEKSLTWFWRTESELMQENVKAMNWIHSVIWGDDDQEENKLV
jgi:hypothetical protein